MTEISGDDAKRQDHTSDNLARPAHSHEEQFPSAGPTAGGNRVEEHGTLRRGPLGLSSPSRLYSTPYGAQSAAGWAVLRP